MNINPLANDLQTAPRSRKNQQLQALTLVKNYPGHTSAELARLGALDRYQLARRLPELITVEKRFMRRCNVSGKLAITWYEK